MIADPDFGFQTVNVLNQQADRNSLLHNVREMIYSRKKLSVLAKGTLEWLDDLPPKVLCFWRRSEDERLLLLHNLSDEDYRFKLPEGYSYSDALNHSSRKIHKASISLPPYGYRWLRAEPNNSITDTIT